jgi:hypothetical protein
VEGEEGSTRTDAGSGVEGTHDAWVGTLGSTIQDPPLPPCLLLFATSVATPPSCSSTRHRFLQDLNEGILDSFP